MWFYFGIFTGIVVLIYKLHEKLKIKSALQLRKKALVPVHREYSYAFDTPSKNKPGYAYLEIPCSTAVQFSARHERGRDKWAKKFSVSHEFEIGTPNFDDRIYLASITETDAELLGTNKEISKLILKVLDGADFGAPSFHNELICDGQVLHLKITYKHDDFFIDKKLPILKELAKHLSNFKYTGTHFWKVPAQRNTAIILAISSTFAILGFFEFIKLYVFKDNQLFSPWSLAPTSILIAIVGTLSLIFALFKWVKKSARRHLVLFEICVSGFFGLIFSGYGLVNDINAEFDNSPPKIVNYEVTGKYTERHRRRRSTYYTYHLRLKEPIEPVEESIKVSNNFYSQISAGDYVTLSIREGYLSFPWLEKINKCTSCNTSGTW